MLDITHLRQTSPDRARLLGSEVKREVLLVFVKFPEVLALFLVGDSQDTRNRLADGVTEHCQNEK